MITDNGKSIIAKYLVGQSPAYASYIAVGCGPKPLEPDSTFGDYSLKKTLDFEMFRVPITSRGFIKEDDGTAKVVLTAELPTEERYEISEIGVYSAGSNPTAGAYDSKTLFSFSEAEGWKYDNQTSLESKYEPLDKDGSSGEIYIKNNGEDVMAFQTNANNRIFTNPERVARYERCRFLNNIIITNGSMSNISTEIVDGVTRLKANTGSHYIGLTGTSLSLNKNAPTDQIKLAFSVVNKNKNNVSPINPDKVYILIEFSDSDIYGAGQWARFEVMIDLYDFSINRYFVITKALEDLRKSTSGFDWSAVNTVKIYTTVIKDNEISDDFYICFDAIRLENITSVNPLYGLVGYTVVKNNNAETIIKSANSTSYIEFRFAMGVNNG
jgi:hypothetical protein